MKKKKLKIYIPTKKEVSKIYNKIKIKKRIINYEIIDEDNLHIVHNTLCKCNLKKYCIRCNAMFGTYYEQCDFINKNSILINNYINERD